MNSVATASTPVRSSTDVAVRRLLRIPDGSTATEGAARRSFEASLAVSATRCLLTYIVLPFLAPIFGLAAGLGPALGIPIGVMAIVANVFTIRRFWAADHRWRWAYTLIALAVIGLLVVLMVRDVAGLVG